jgi:hypothetical protein
MLLQQLLLQARPVADWLEYAAASSACAAAAAAAAALPAQSCHAAVLLMLLARWMPVLQACQMLQGGRQQLKHATPQRCLTPTEHVQ